jgi:hypothetical protein
MDILAFLTAKPVLIGLHLGFAILGIDAFLWLLGEIVADSISIRRRMCAALLGAAGFTGSWLVGGYYYVTYYGPLVKPVINAGAAPWAHAIAMETKEHVFLLLIPMIAVTLLLARLDTATLSSLRLKIPFAILTGAVAFIGLGIGLLGYIISAAVRWGGL